MALCFQMGSRLTWQVAGGLLMAAGGFGKFGAILATIPDPVLGGILIVSIGMVVSVGLSNIQFVDLSGGRNLMILGTSLLVGITVPSWILVNATHINTGKLSNLCYCFYNLFLITLYYHTFFSNDACLHVLKAY